MTLSPSHSESSNELKLLLLSKHGSKSALFDSMENNTAGVLALDWHPLHNARSIMEYAESIADAWISNETANLKSGEPFLLAGVSIGGIVALEVGYALWKRHKVPPSAVLLIASCYGSEAVSRKLKRTITASLLLPAPIRSWLTQKFFLPWLIKREKLSLGDARDLRRLYQDLDWSFWGPMLELSKRWDRAATEIDSFPFAVHQIHGANDPIIAPPKYHDATLLFRGGHLIDLTHKQEIYRWISAIWADLALKNRQQKHTK